MEILGVEPLAKSPWLGLFRIFYRFQAGDDRSWVAASRRKTLLCVDSRIQAPDAVVIVPFDPIRRKLVATREYRVPLGDYEYGFPAGLVEAGETVEDTARRELKEETGLEVTRILETSPPIYSSAGITDESITMVYVECAGEPSEHPGDGSELIEVFFLSPRQAARLCRNSSIKFDAKAWLVMSQFAVSGAPCPSSGSSGWISGSPASAD